MSSTHPARPPSIDFSSLLAELDASDPSVAAFARSRGLTPWRLYHALNRRKARLLRAETRASAALPRMLPVSVVPDAIVKRPSSTLELELAGGHRLRIGADFDADLLRRVLGALKRC